MLTRVVLPKELLTLVKIRPTVSLVKIRLPFLFLPQGILNGCCHPYGRQPLSIMEIPQPTLPCGVMFRYMCENSTFPIKAVLSYFLSYHPHTRDQPECSRRLNGSESKTSSRQVCTDQSHHSEHCTKHKRLSNKKIVSSNYLHLIKSLFVAFVVYNMTYSTDV